MGSGTNENGVSGGAGSGADGIVTTKGDFTSFSAISATLSFGCYAAGGKLGTELYSFSFDARSEKEIKDE